MHPLFPIPTTKKASVNKYGDSLLSDDTYT